GNVADAGGNSLDDWNTLNGTGTGGANPGGSAGSSSIRVFAPGPDAPEIFTTGGSKDPSDIPNWKWTTGSVPDKDKLTNGYAAAYTAQNGDFILVFGADRFAQNGDSNIGVWFFQSNVAPLADGTFSGQHTIHDILAVSAFTQGGGVSTITVYEWNPACNSVKFVNNPPVAGTCADNNLKTLFSSAQVCTASGTGHDACAVVNNVLLS